MFGIKYSYHVGFCIKLYNSDTNKNYLICEDGIIKLPFKIKRSEDINALRKKIAEMVWNNTDYQDSHHIPIDKYKDHKDQTVIIITGFHLLKD